jgi:Ser/Thr protein kinase RdoA (MazF antagonist)
MVRTVLDIQGYVEENYPFIGKIKKVEKLKHNDINSINYLIRTAKKYYTLRNVTDGSKSKKIEVICKILDFCVRNKIKVIEPIKDKNSKYIDKKNMVYLTKYYKGNTYTGKTSELYDLAKNLANLHKIMAKNKINYNYRTDINRYYKILTPNELQSIKRKIEKKSAKDIFDRKVYQNLDFLNECIEQDRITSHIIKKLKFKRQLIHRDIHPNNVIFNKSKVSAIIDFNGMRKSRTIEDIAFTSFRFALFQTTNPDKIKKRLRLFLSTYLRHNHIDIKELIHLRYFFTHEMLLKLGLILRKRYFVKSNAWTIDFDMIINFVKIVNKMDL